MGHKYIIKYIIASLCLKKSLFGILCFYFKPFTYIFAADILENLLHGKNLNHMQHHHPAQGLEAVTINILIMPHFVL